MVQNVSTGKPTASRDDEYKGEREVAFDEYREGTPT